METKAFLESDVLYKMLENRNVDFMTKIDEEEIAKTSDEIINKIEKFFMTGKGMLYDVHFWKNDICNSIELIYQKMTNQPCKH